MCLLALPAARHSTAGATQRDRELASRFTDPEDAKSFLTSRWLTGEAASRVLDVPAPHVLVTRECTQCGSTAHGQPRSGDLWLSATRRRSLVAAAAGSVRVAVDLEPVGAGADVPDSSLTRRERDADALGRLRLWTRKECLVKLGMCSVDDFGVVSAGEPHLDDVQVGAVRLSSHLVQPQAGQPHVVTVASLGPRPPIPEFVSH